MQGVECGWGVAKAWPRGRVLGRVRPVDQKKKRCLRRGSKEADCGSELRVSRAELLED